MKLGLLSYPRSSAFIGGSNALLTLSAPPTASAADRSPPASAPPHTARCARSRRDRTWQAPPPSPESCRPPFRGIPSRALRRSPNRAVRAPRPARETPGARKVGLAALRIELAQRGASRHPAIDEGQHQRSTRRSIPARQPGHFRFEVLKTGAEAERAPVFPKQLPDGFPSRGIARH